MRCTSILRRLHILPLLCGAFALALPFAAEARTGGGGSFGGFRTGFAPSGGVVFLSTPRGGRAFVSTGRGLHNHGVPVRRFVRPFPVARHASPFIPPRVPVLTGVLVSPLVVVPPVVGIVVTLMPGVVFQPVTGIPARRPAVADDLGLWRSTGGAWQGERMSAPASLWHRGEDGIWRAASSD